MLDSKLRFETLVRRHRLGCFTCKVPEGKRTMRPQPDDLLQAGDSLLFSSELLEGHTHPREGISIMLAKSRCLLRQRFLLLSKFWRLLNQDCVGMKAAHAHSISFNILIGTRLRSCHCSSQQSLCLQHSNVTGINKTCAFVSNLRTS